MAEQPRDLAEAKIWEEVEDKVRAELEPEYDEKRAMEVDRAKRAFVISMALILSLVIPAMGAVIGLAVRLFYYASGLR